MRALTMDLRHGLERSVLEGRRAAELGVRAALGSLGVEATDKPGHLSEEQAQLRRGLRAKQRQLGGGFELLVWECAYEQWHRLLFARYLAENGLLRHPVYEAPVTLAECDELAAELGEPDGWSVAARFASEILPGIFRLDDPTVQLRLAAEHRVALEQIVAALPSEVFVADDSLGWVYQYWQSERKDAVVESEAKIGGADLAPVTQLFTENYMVRFLLENSLGAWWAARHPDSPMVKDFEYLRFREDGQPAAGAFKGWPATVADATVMDPCCGSGHFLVEAFGMLWRMRAEEEGLTPVAAQDAVLRENLFGLELDPRCLQIAMFAVALTAWKQGGGWRQLPTPNIACSGIPAKARLEDWTALAKGDLRLEWALERLHGLFKDADTLGSLIDPRRTTEGDKDQPSLEDIVFHEVEPLLGKAASRETDDPATAVLGADAAGIARAAHLLSRTYTLVATNVPFLGRRKQSEELRTWTDKYHPLSSHDLGSTMVERSMKLAGESGAVAVVHPEKFLNLGSFKQLRKSLLERVAWRVIARLGFPAFSTPMYQLGMMLAVFEACSPDANRTAAIEALNTTVIEEKANSLRVGEVSFPLQSSQLLNPDYRFLTEIDALAGMPRLSERSRSVQGLLTGDDPRFKRSFWEHEGSSSAWVPAQLPGRLSGGSFRAGLELCLVVPDGLGELANTSGKSSWGSKGLLVAQSGSFRVTPYLGGVFFYGAALFVPKDPDEIPAIWAYASSDEYRHRVRTLDTKVLVTNATLTKVPFDVERWQLAAAEEFPEGLPEPWSDDPTQWLFEGRPEVSTEPLQVGVGRLVGYRWPEQPEQDGLDGHADADGIVCLPAVRGEPPAADRLSALLADAYGDEWSSGLAARLLDEAGATKTTLADWLRDGFFKHHCKVFSNRPFVWHIWDGRKDGFAALVNYHRLDRAGLEKLTYTYLGDWIERQRADAADEVAGADLRLAAALELRGKLEAILEGEPPFDIYVRWKSLDQQPIGWDPDLDDGVRLNIRPFVEAGVLRSKVNVHWKKDRGKNPDGSERHNDLHYTNDQKRQARQEAGSG